MPAVLSYSLLEAPVANRPPRGLVDRLPYEVGRWVDEGALLYEAWRVGRASADRLRERAERYRLAVEYLESEGIFADPKRLYPPPTKAPEVERKPINVFGFPPFESIRFRSRAAEVFPPELGTRANDPTAKNLWARAHLWRHGNRGRPAILCIHGYRGGFAPLEAWAFGVGRLHGELGFDVALPVLPYHGSRAPQGSRSGALFLNDPRRTLEAVVQAVADLRALVAWLRAQGASRVGVVGMSLGGYMTALLASIEPNLDFAAPVIPVASFADILWERAGRRGEHAVALDCGLNLELLRRLFRPHCPLDFQPLLPAERRMVIAGVADRIVPAEHPIALAAQWQTEVRWFPGGHLAQLGRERAFRRFLEMAVRR